MTRYLKPSLPPTTQLSQAARKKRTRFFLFVTLLIFPVLLAAGYRLLPQATTDDPYTYFPWAQVGECEPREAHTATKLVDGRVLLVGGRLPDGGAVLPDFNVEIFDPGSGQSGFAANLATGRSDHSATRLQDGKVLVAGGQTDEAVLGSTEIFNPLGAQWLAGGSLAGPRSGHTATLLLDGKVLVAGGHNDDPLSSAEIYDPSSGLWSPTGSMNNARDKHTATLLPDGKVLVAGGEDDGGVLATAEIYDPATGMWTLSGSMAGARMQHSATLLDNGLVLAAGGTDGSSPTATAELFDPSSGLWSGTGSMQFARDAHSATLLENGQVLVAGGGTSGFWRSELYNPSSGLWQVESELGIRGHKATLLDNGQVLVSGGLIEADTYVHTGALVAYSRTSGTFEETAEPILLSRFRLGADDDLDTGRLQHSATLLPGGKILVAGGYDGSIVLDSAELFDPATANWSATGSLGEDRLEHTTTLLENGKVLVAGGFDGFVPLATAELYDPGTGMWTATGSMKNARDGHEATLLADGRVLVSGGFGAVEYLADAEIYDPDTGMWSMVGSMSEARYLHTAVALEDGKVLAAGGLDFDGQDFKSIDSAEIFDPATNMWTPTDSLSAARHEHAATRLANGKVLVSGGIDHVLATQLKSAELYNPQTGMWEAAGTMGVERSVHTSTRLPNGQVLITGGTSNCCFLNSAELYDPDTNSWTPTGSMKEPGRVAHRATLANDFRVLITGGRDIDGNILDNTEFYNSDLQDFNLSYGDFIVQSPSINRFYDRYNDYGMEITMMFVTDLDYYNSLNDLTAVWEPNARALQEEELFQAGLIATSSAANTFITQEQIDGLETFFDTMGDKASSGLKQALEDEGDLLPPYQDFVGKSVLEAREMLYDGLNTENWATTTSIASSQNPVDAGQEVTFTAQVSQDTSNFPAQGDVTFYDGATPLATVAVDANFVAQYSTSSLTPGSHAISAKYNGAETIASSESDPLDQVVDGTDKREATTTTLTADPNPSQSGQQVTLKAVIALDSGSGKASGQVTFFDGTTVLGSVPVSNNEAEFSTNKLTVGDHALTAKYDGDENYMPSTSTVVNHKVEGGTTPDYVVYLPGIYKGQ